MVINDPYFSTVLDEMFDGRDPLNTAGSKLKVDLSELLVFLDVEHKLSLGLLETHRGNNALVVVL